MIITEQALLGKTISIPTLSGDSFNYSLPSPFRDVDKDVVIKDKGLPNTDTVINNIWSLYGWRGKLMLNVHVDFPNELTEEQKRLVEDWPNGMFLSDDDDDGDDEMGEKKREERKETGDNKWGEENGEDRNNEEYTDIDLFHLDIDKETSY